MKKIDLICEYCQKPFQRLLALHKGNQKRGRQHTFCSIQCGNNFKKNIQVYSCKTCCKLVQRHPSDIVSSGNIFCSSSCAAQYNNKIITKRKLTNKCYHCNEFISKHLRFCRDCKQKIIKNGHSVKSILRKNYNINIDVEKSIGDLALEGGKSSKHSYLRNHARSVIKDRPKLCERCGYSKYVECCHIKAIKEFSEDTPISIVNHPNNLLWLCPNCHVEMDKNL